MAARRPAVDAPTEHAAQRQQLAAGSDLERAMSGPSSEEEEGRQPAAATEHPAGGATAVAAAGKRPHEQREWAPPCSCLWTSLAAVAQRANVGLPAQEA